MTPKETFLLEVGRLMVDDVVIHIHANLPAIHRMGFGNVDTIEIHPLSVTFANLVQAPGLSPERGSGIGAERSLVVTRNVRRIG